MHTKNRAVIATLKKLRKELISELNHFYEIQEKGSSPVSYTPAEMFTEIAGVDYQLMDRAEL